MSIVGTRGYPSFYGGFETLVRKLAPYLVNDGWDTIVYSRPKAVKLDDPDLDSRVRSIVTRGLEKQSLSTLTYGMTSSVDAALKNVDVALIMNVANGFWLPILKARGIRTVVNVDGIEWERAKWGTAAKRAFMAGAKMTAKYADELVFDSVGIADYWNEYFDRTGTFIPYGGELEYPTIETPQFEKGTYALIVARFVPENSIEEFIAAIELMGDTPVVVVGSSGYDGPYDEKMRELEESRANVTWLGHVKDDRLLFSLWENSGAYFHGHSVGGTNPALVQAMACSAPIVARDTTYNREVLAENGIFVDPVPGAIAEQLQRLVSDTELQVRLGAGARNRAASAYTWNGVCKSYSELLRSAIT